MGGKTGPVTEEGKKKVTQNLPNDKDRSAWNYTEKGRKAQAKAAKMGQLKHGFYADVPILCKGETCPYGDACYIEEEERPVGEPCPVETSTIEELVDKYIQKFDISKDDMANISMVKSLVDIEVSLTRCNKKLAVDPGVVKQIVVAATEDGRPLTQPEIDKAYDLKQKLRRQRRNILNDLVATPKEKAKLEQETKSDPSSIVATMRKNLKDMSGDGEEVTVEVEEN